jgi:hypothetical protein
LSLSVSDANKTNNWQINLPCTEDGELSGDGVAAGLNQLAANVLGRVR